MNKETNNFTRITPLTEREMKYFLKFFYLSKERLQSTQVMILENSSVNFNYIFLLISSVFVVITGMTNDSPAVVIGGMLISPLFWPLLGLAITLSRGEKKLYLNELLILIKSLLIVFFVSILFGTLAPENILQSNEFISRTTPTFFDLSIGLLAGFLGAYIVAHPKISSAFGGIAIAAALLPPIVVTGVALTKGDMNSFIGALLLTSISIISMTFTALILFYIAHIRKNVGYALKKQYPWVISFSVIFISILGLLSYQIWHVNFDNNQVLSISNNFFGKDSVSSIKTSYDQTGLNIDIQLVSSRVPTDDEINEYSNQIAQILKQSVDVQLSIVPEIIRNNTISYPTQ